MIHPPSQHPDLVAFLDAVLGSRRVIEDMSRSFGRQSVMWRIDAGADRYWLKRHQSSVHYDREVIALTNYAPRLEGVSVPEVVSRDDGLGALILSDVPGSHPNQMELSLDESAEVHRLAGAAARSLHAMPLDETPEIPYAASFMEAVERALLLSEPHLDSETISWVERVVDGGAAFEGSSYVMAHMDFSPRNWLVDRNEGGFRLGVIDWERARFDHWLQDVQRMVPDDWEQDPALRVAYFEGYGREPDEREVRQLDLLVLLGSVGAVWWSAEHGDTEYEAYGRRLVARMRDEWGRE